MSVLVILLPARTQRGAAPDAADGHAFVYSADGRAVTQHGRALAAQLPRAELVCAAVADTELSWHAIDVPRAPAARLRAAVLSMLEDHVLDDEADLHVALEPGAATGRRHWVAVTPRAPLAAALGALEQAGVLVERVVPLSTPGAADSNAAAQTLRVHALPLDGDTANPLLLWSSNEGLAALRMAGSLSRHRLAEADRSRLVCSAHPAVAAATEQWAGMTVAVRSDAERALEAAAGPWNLRQFDLAASHRGLHAVRAAWRQWQSPAWRPVRWGVAALLLANLAGLNLWAWSQQRQVDEHRQALVRLLQTTHPQVRSVIDAPVQMQRETELLRAASGRPGPQDVEALLALAAAAWPGGAPAATQVQFEPGRLTLVTAGWQEPQRQHFIEQVRAAGGRAELQGEQFTVSAGDRP